MSKNYSLNLYIDDSGSRELDKALDKQEGSKWFALGGFLIKEEDEDIVRLSHEKLCNKWNITYPLHSYDIRCRRRNFKWLDKIGDSKRNEFYEDIADFVGKSCILCIACVINRDGYNKRYREIYGRQRWQLSKTAFPIVVERSAKFASCMGRRMKVYFEKSDKNIDRELLSHFQLLQTEGMPFNKDRSSSYSPLEGQNFKKILWECRSKTKSSALMQLADLVLFPLCVGGYDKTHKTYKELKSMNKIIDDHLPQKRCTSEGVKYYCFD